MTPTLEHWLQQLSAGALARDQPLTLDPARAERLAGLPRLALCDVPLLLLASAVEGGSSYFRIHGNQSLSFSWDGKSGPTLDTALSILKTEDVDHSLQAPGTLVLPELFRELIQPLLKRSKHAPLSLIIGDRLAWSNPAGEGVWAGPSRQPRLVLVDRGVDFEMPFALPGLQVVARVGTLTGAPWPVRVVWDQKLEDFLRRVLRPLFKP